MKEDFISTFPGSWAKWVCAKFIEGSEEVKLGWGAWLGYPEDVAWFDYSIGSSFFDFLFFLVFLPEFSSAFEDSFYSSLSFGTYFKSGIPKD